MIGKTLGNFECTALLGKGGMGEVYKAKDQKLGRDVAIKVLPEEFARDSERVARFQREAKLLASLNHPNIAAIYGLEESDGTNFLVMELVEGNTLDDRIKSGSIPVEEALKLALQITEALEAAHEKGVIHRDLKPANIKVTPDGKVKVLDFGLAKAFAGEQADLNLSNSPTLSQAATMQGVILGTAAYMSPEQAKGKTVDKRTDIWAFGAVLFEMLTGKAAFQGDEVSEILASVIKGDTNLDILPSNIHQRVREVISRCLQKELRKRYPDIANARYEVEQVLADPGGVFVQSVTATKPKTKVRVSIPWVVATSILCLIIAGVASWLFKPVPPPEPAIHYEYFLPEDQEFTGPVFGKCLTVSPDGTKIVYAANGQLYLKKSNELTANPIRGSDENPTFPCFSPDGQWVVYLSLRDNQFKRISINGGSSVKLYEGLNLSTPIWAAEDMIVFGGRGRITLFSPNNGTTEEIIKGEEDDWLVYPQILPGGKSVLYSIESDRNKGFQFAVQSLDAEKPKFRLPGGPARYLPTGHIVYGSENTLTAIRFDPDTLETIGGEVPLIEDVYRLSPIRTTHVAISDSGTLVYIPGRMGTAAMGTLVWVDREGTEESIDEEPRIYDTSKISPDGTQVAFTITVDGNDDVYIYDLVRKTTPRRLTRHEAFDAVPIWTNDCKRIIFSSAREGRNSIFLKAASGTGDAEQIAQIDDSDIWPMSLSKDGKTLFFQQMILGNGNIGMLPMDGDRTPELLLQEEYQERFPQISPQEDWLAYHTNESGQYEVYIHSFPDMDGGRKKQVSVDGGRNPIWSPLDGKELFYLNLSDELMVVSVETDPDLKLGDPQRLFDTRQYLGWDIHPGGKRFLMIKAVEAMEADSARGNPRKIILITNWFEELKEMVPVK